MKTGKTAIVLAAAGLLALSACSNEGEDTTQGEPELESRSLASLLATDEDLEITAEAMNDAGLTSIFDGAAYYTLLAPTDEAIESVGEDGREIAGDADQRAALVAVLRDHILPGYLTIEDISAAIDNAGGSVEMQTMGEDALTFTADGDDIRVVGTGGASALIRQDEALADNGVLLPVNGLLKPL